MAISYFRQQVKQEIVNWFIERGFKKVSLVFGQGELLPQDIIRLEREQKGDMDFIEIAFDKSGRQSFDLIFDRRSAWQSSTSIGKLPNFLLDEHYWFKDRKIFRSRLIDRGSKNARIDKFVKRAAINLWQVEDFFESGTIGRNVEAAM